MKVHISKPALVCLGTYMVRTLEVGSYRDVTWFFLKNAVHLPFLLTALQPGTAELRRHCSCLTQLLEIHFWDAWILDTRDGKLTPDLSTEHWRADLRRRCHAPNEWAYHFGHRTMQKGALVCNCEGSNTLSPTWLACATAWAFLSCIVFFLWLFNFALFLLFAAATVSCLHRTSTQPTRELRALPSNTHVGWWNPSAAQPQRGMAQ